MHIRENKIPNAILKMAMWLCARLPGGRRAASPRRILITRLGNLGDFIVAVPALRALRKRYPEARLVLLTSPTRRGAPGARELFANDPIFDEMIVYYADESGSMRFLRDLREKLAAEEFDLAIALPNQMTPFWHLLKYIALLAASGIRRFSGFELVTPSDYKSRQVDRLMRLVRQLGPAGDEPFPWLKPTLEEHAQAEALLGAAKGRTLIGMHSGAKRPANRWSPDAFVEVGARLIAEDGAYIVLTGSFEEKEVTATLAARLGAHCVDLGGKTPLGLLAAIAQRCDAFVSNDTGVMHVAYAMGAPTVAIFSARFHPNIWYPYGDRQIVLRKEIDCALCDKDVCPLHEYPECLALIQPDEVVEAVRSLLARNQSARAAGQAE